MVKQWPTNDQTVVNEWSTNGQTVVNHNPKFKPIPWSNVTPCHPHQRTHPLCATSRYFSDVTLISFSVSTAMSIFFLMSLLVCFASSNDSINSTSVVTSPSASANFCKMVSSKNFNFTLYWLFCSIKKDRWSAKSFRSFRTTNDSNWSSKPDWVTVKFTMVVSACNSGA